MCSRCSRPCARIAKTVERKRATVDSLQSGIPGSRLQQSSMKCSQMCLERAGRNSRYCSRTAISRKSPSRGLCFTAAARQACVASGTEPSRTISQSAGCINSRRARSSCPTAQRSPDFGSGERCFPPAQCASRGREHPATIGLRWVRLSVTFRELAAMVAR